MAPKEPILEQMRRKPQSDWGISDVQRVCDEYGIDLMKPSRGSHYKAASPLISAHQCIPHNRPIKAIYIKALVAMIDVHIDFEKAKKGAG